MSAKNVLLSASFVVACLAGGGTRAFDLTEVFEDPLQTLPSMLQSGPVFPDGSPVLCPVVVDLGHALKLGDVIGLALCNNPQVKQAWLDIRIAAGQVGEARSTYLPTATASYSPYQANQVEYPDSPDNWTFNEGTMASANLTWRLLDFGARSANYEATKLTLAAALASHEAILQRAMQVLTQNYFDVLSGEASVAAKNDAVVLAKSAWEATLRREAKGVSDKYDSLQAQSALAKARLAASRANGDLDKAYVSLVSAVGLPTNTQIRLQESPMHAAPLILNNLEFLLTQARKDHPAIKSAKLQWAASKEKVRATSSAGSPSLDLVASLYKNGLPNQGVQSTSSYTGNAGITINIPVFEGFGATYRVRGAQASAEKAQTQLDDTEHQVLSEIVKAHADTVSSLANLDSSQSLIDAAQAAVASAIKRYEAGSTDVFELLNAQSALAQAKEERLKCISEWRSARLRLEASAGILVKIGDLE